MRILGLVALTSLSIGTYMLPVAAYAQTDIAISVDVFAPPPVELAPPPLPVYVIPEPPVESYVWLPGHWQWGPYGYFWVPGTWVEPPVIGYLWTPGYWGWNDGYFMWHEGYWAEHVGYYGGIHYGGGYEGYGFYGGHWDHRHYMIDRSYVNVTNITIINKNVVINRNTGNASFNGGPGGTTARPTVEELAVTHERHVPLTDIQRQHIEGASRNAEFAVSHNQGRPAIAATAKPDDFIHNVMPAREAGPMNKAAEQHNEEVRKSPNFDRKNPTAPITSTAPSVRPPEVRPNETHQNEPRANETRPALTSQPDIASPHEAIQPHDNLQHNILQHDVPQHESMQPTTMRPTTPQLTPQVEHVTPIQERTPVITTPHEVVRPIEAPQTMQPRIEPEHITPAPQPIQHPADQRPAEQHPVEIPHEQIRQAPPAALTGSSERNHEMARPAEQMEHHEEEHREETSPQEGEHHEH